ncbi:MAG: hypothetical protein JWM21_2635 [Acidobacteria bacterium]|nr:hypothetical protein [Acidobacteriota bacterium]
MSKQEDANLILKLYDLRREPVMRDARNWFFTFNPASINDFFEALMNEHSGHYRMVVSYWDMAASMVNQGAIDEELFNASGGEMVFVYAKIAKFLPELREAFGAPELLLNMETLVKRIPNIDEKIEKMTARMKQFAAMREERAAKTQAATS